MAFALALFGLLAPSLASAEQARPSATLPEPARVEVKIHYEAGASGPTSGKTIKVTELKNYKDAPVANRFQVSVPRLAAALAIPPRQLTSVIAHGVENGKPRSLALSPKEIMGETGGLLYFEGIREQVPSESEVVLYFNEPGGESRVRSGGGGVLSVDLYVRGSVFTVATPQFWQEGERKGQTEMIAGQPVELFEPVPTPTATGRPISEDYVYTWRFDDDEEKFTQEAKKTFPALAAGGYEHAVYNVYVEVDATAGNAGGVGYTHFAVLSVPEPGGTPTHPQPTSAAPTIPTGPTGPAGPEPASSGGAATGPAASSGAPPTAAAPVAGATGPTPVATGSPAAPPHRASPARTKHRAPNRHASQPGPSQAAHAGSGGGGSGAVGPTLGGSGNASAGSAFGSATGSGEAATAPPPRSGTSNSVSGSAPPDAPHGSAKDVPAHLPFPTGPPRPRGLVGVLLSSPPGASAAVTEASPLSPTLSPRLQLAKTGGVESSSEGTRYLSWILGITAMLLIVSVGVVLELEPRTLYRKLRAH